MKKFIKIILIAWVFLVFGFVAISLTIKKPPLLAISQARVKMAEAQKIFASKYAPELWPKALSNYNRAMTLWKAENEKLFFNRKYELIQKHADLSVQYAEKAISKTKSRINSAVDLINVRISVIEDKYDQFQHLFGSFPYSEVQHEQLNKGKIYLHEAVFAYKQNNYQRSSDKLDAAEAIIDSQNQYYSDKLSEYFKQYNQWQTNVNAAIDQSKKLRKNCLIISKYERKCCFYSNGILQHKFNIELGANWIGDKNYMGDKSTPEGNYKIIAKKQNGNTKYYKALLLDYPNSDDKRRFLINKQEGIIPPDAKIGNLIEIHGEGGKGVDWTDGCIALSNNEMDKLFAACKIETPVIIVGSLLPLNDILLNNNE